MYSIGEIKKQNQQSARDEANRAVASYEKQENGDVWTSLNGRKKILSGFDAEQFLAAIKGFSPGQLRAFLTKSYTAIHA